MRHPNKNKAKADPGMARRRPAAGGQWQADGGRRTADGGRRTTDAWTMGGGRRTTDDGRRAIASTFDIWRRYIHKMSERSQLLMVAPQVLWFWKD